MFSKLLLLVSQLCILGAVPDPTLNVEFAPAINESSMRHLYHRSLNFSNASVRVAKVLLPVGFVAVFTVERDKIPDNSDGLYSVSLQGNWPPHKSCCVALCTKKEMPVSLGTTFCASVLGDDDPCNILAVWMRCKQVPNP